jgi:hypothetical protein
METVRIRDPGWKKAGLWIRIHFFRIRIRIQSLMLKTNTDPGIFNDPKIVKKITAEIFFSFFFLSKTAIYISLGLHKVCPSYRRSLQLSKEAIQRFKTKTFSTFFLLCGSFFPSWIRIRIPNPDPDPQTRLNTDPVRIQYGSGSASTTLEKSRIRDPG